jgi:hypothetical protein
LNANYMWGYANRLNTTGVAYLQYISLVSGNVSFLLRGSLALLCTPLPPYVNVWNETCLSIFIDPKVTFSVPRSVDRLHCS